MVLCLQLLFCESSVSVKQNLIEKKETNLRELREEKNIYLTGNTKKMKSHYLNKGKLPDFHQSY